MRFNRGPLWHATISGEPEAGADDSQRTTGYRQVGRHPKVNLSPKGVCNVVNRQLAEAGLRQLSNRWFVTLPRCYPN